MRTLIIVSLFLFVPCLVFASNSNYVFVIDENSNPLWGYKILETPKDDVYISKTEPIKKWIISLKSRLIVVHDGYVYSVKDSIIVDKKREISVLLIDFSERKPLYFNPEEKLIDRDIRKLVENKKSVLAKLFPSETKKEKKKPSLHDYLALAEQYENNGQLDKAISIYEEILKQDTKNQKIINKIGIIYYRVGNFKKASEYFAKLPETEDVVVRLFGIYIIEKDYEKALKIINNSGINSAYLHYLKGIVYYLTNKKDDAYREVSILFNLDRTLSQNLRDLLR